MDFEAMRPRLTAIAFRLLGSVQDAEDAVQNTWLKASAAHTATSAIPMQSAPWSGRPTRT